MRNFILKLIVFLNLIAAIMFIAIPSKANINSNFTFKESCIQFESWSKPIQKMYVKSFLKSVVRTLSMEDKVCIKQKVEEVRIDILSQCKMGKEFEDVLDKAIHNVQEICKLKKFKDTWFEWGYDEDTLFEYPFKD